MSVLNDEFIKRFERPADILYCPCCTASDSNWEKAFYNTVTREIVGCDACVFPDFDAVEPCPVCGEAEENPYRDKITKQTVGCASCIVGYKYGECLEYFKERFL